MTLSAWPELHWQRNSDGLFYAPAGQIEKIADKRGLVEVPQLAQEHWAKVQAVLTAVSDLRLWEHEHQLSHRRLAVLAGMREVQYYSDYINGLFDSDLGPIGERYRQPITIEQIKRII